MACSLQVMPCYLLRQWAAAWVGPQPLLLPNSIPATACWSKTASSRRLTRHTGADASKSANQLVSPQNFLSACISKACHTSQCKISVALLHCSLPSVAMLSQSHMPALVYSTNKPLLAAKETTWSVLNIWGHYLARLEQSSIYQVKASAAIHLHMHCWSFVS